MCVAVTRARVNFPTSGGSRKCRSITNTFALIGARGFKMHTAGRFIVCMFALHDASNFRSRIFHRFIANACTMGVASICKIRAACRFIASMFTLHDALNFRLRIVHRFVANTCTMGVASIFKIRAARRFIACMFA